MTKSGARHLLHAAVLGGLLASGTAINAISLPAAGAEPEPVLGSALFDSSTGYGTARPNQLSQGGTCGGDVILKIKWDSWGGPVASGAGFRCLTAGEAAEGKQPEPVSLTASNPGECHGKLAYRTLRIGSASPSSVCVAQAGR